jgi:hypothetical protein
MLLTVLTSNGSIIQAKATLGSHSSVPLSGQVNLQSKVSFIVREKHYFVKFCFCVYSRTEYRVQNTEYRVTHTPTLYVLSR